MRDRARPATAIRTAQDYVFKGEKLGQVEPIRRARRRPRRLDSYTESFRERQLAELFAGTQYRFRHFKKTDGYANLPLDGLWLRAPYLHNGSVPTLADLLEPPEERPKAFKRGSTWSIAAAAASSPACDPAPAADGHFCFDTRCPATARAATSTEPICRRRRSPISSPIC